MIKINTDGIYFEYKETLAPEQKSFFPHLHSDYELFYFTEGDVEYIVGESVYRLQKNDLLLIRPSVYHYPRILSQKKYIRTIVNFPKEFLADARLPDENGPVRFRLPPSGNMANLFKCAIDATERFSETEAFSAIRHILNLIFLYLKFDDRQEADPSDAIHPLLSDILRYIDENLRSPLSVRELSDKFFISPSWLTHAFQKHLHIGVMQYITRKKILYAQSLIRSGTPPTEAAKTCALDNYSTVYRQYKRYLGIQPKNDRRQ